MKRQMPDGSYKDLGPGGGHKRGTRIFAWSPGGYPSEAGRKATRRNKGAPAPWSR